MGHRYTEAEEDFIVEGWNVGLSIEEMAESLGRTEHAVRVRVSVLRGEGRITDRSLKERNRRRVRESVERQQAAMHDLMNGEALNSYGLGSPPITQELPRRKRKPDLWATFVVMSLPVAIGASYWLGTIVEASR